MITFIKTIIRRFLGICTFITMIIMGIFLIPFIGLEKFTNGLERCLETLE